MKSKSTYQWNSIDLNVNFELQFCKVTKKISKV